MFSSLSHNDCSGEYDKKLNIALRVILNNCHRTGVVLSHGLLLSVAHERSPLCQVGF